MTTMHGWVGSSPIRVAVDVPAAARAGVVICAPVGQEGVIAYRALRLLADTLAAHGIASVRYDPAGHGDSAPLGPGDTAAQGHDDTGASRADGAVRSALEAARLLGDMGCTRPAFVGLASAALVAAEAARESGAPVVLVDPPASGKAWVRRQRALAAMTIPTGRTTPDRETLVGVDLTPEEIAAFQAMRLDASPGQPVLVAVRPGYVAPAALPDDVDHVEVEGMAELLDGESIRARIPIRAIDTVSDWVASHVERTRDPLRTPTLSTTLTLPDGSSERIRTYGPERLFGIETIPAGTDADAARPGAPVVLLHNGAAEHRVGASDYQVTLARALVADGVHVVRVDRRGTGESGDVHADEASFLFTDEWVDDQDAIIADLGVRGDRLAIVGMCAGAWLAARSAHHRPGLVVEISPNDYRRRTAEPGSYAAALVAVDDASGLRLALRGWWNRLVPERIRHAVDRRGRRGGPADQLTPLARAGTSVALLMGPGDARLFDELGGDRVEGRLRSLDVVRVEEGDHSLFSPLMRDVVIAEVRARVASAFPAPTRIDRHPVTA